MTSIRNTKWWSLCWLAASVVAVHAAAEPPGPLPSGDDAPDLHGVLLVDGGGPVDVEVVDADDVVLRSSTRSDGAGRFEFSNLARGSHWLRVTFGRTLLRERIVHASDRMVYIDLRGRSPTDGPPRSRRTRPSARGDGLAFSTAVETFEDANISDYASAGGIIGGVAAASAHDGSWGLNITDQVFPGWIYRTSTNVAVGDTIDAWVQPGMGGRAYVGFGANVSGTYALAVGVNTNSFVLQYVPYGSTHEEFAQVPFAWVPGQWYRIEATWTALRTVQARIYDSNGTTQLASVSGTSSTSPGASSGGISWRGFGGSQDFDTYGLSTGSPTPVPALPAGWLALCVACGGLSLAAFLKRR